MILARTFHPVLPADLERLSRRVGRSVTMPAGGFAVLLTGLSEARATALGGAGDAAVITDLSRAPEALALPAPAPLALGGRIWRFDERPLVMGIVNVTPDSFSDGGRFATTDAAVAHALQLLEEGADWLDVGGESTRPGAPSVSLEDECARVLPVIEVLARRAPQALVSIDTSKAEVARRALEAGAALVNDVTAFGDPAMAQVVAKAEAGACLMHMQGTPRTMQAAPTYGDVVAEVAEALAAAIGRATSGGVSRSRLLVDPGIGFGKTVAHNLELLRHLGALRALGVPVLLGTSRKSFLGALTGTKTPDQRVVASASTVALAAALSQADVVRVHDAKATRDALAVACAVRSA